MLEFFHLVLNGDAIMVQANRIRVTDEWFTPHFPPREDRPLEIAMLQAWKEHMEYEDEHACGWCPRIVSMLAHIPRGISKRSSCVATTCAVWLMMPVGQAVLEPLLRKTGSQSPGSGFWDERAAIQTWAWENRLDPSVSNRLAHLLRTREGEWFYKVNKFPTHEDNRAAEMTLCFLVAPVGRKLLKKVAETAGQPDIFPI